MSGYINGAQILLSAILTLAILLQIRGGGLGGIFGQQSSVFRTRRGLERTLFRFTILLVVLFIGLALISVRMGR